MEIKLQKDSISYYSKALSIEFSQEETSETIVPDTLPDIATVVDSDAIAVLRGKELNDGRLTVNGMIFGYVIYRSEGEESLRRMPVQLPFSAHWDSGSITQSCKCAVKLSVSSFEGRIINSRKLLLRGEIVVNADVFAEEKSEFTTGSDCTELETNTEDITFSHICAVGEKTFTVSEEMLLPASKPGVGNIIKYRVRLFCDEVKPVGGKLVVKGRAAVYILYTAEDSGEINSADFSLPFSQIYDTDTSADILAASASLMVTGVYLEEIDNGGTPNGFRIEIGAVAQLCAWSESEISCVADAYSIQHEITLTPGTVCLHESQQGQGYDETVIQIINTASPVKNVIDVYTYIGKARFEDGSAVWSASVRALYEAEDGKIVSCFGNFELKCACPDGAFAEVFVGDITAKAVSGGAELRIPVKYSITLCGDIEISTPAEIEIDEEAVKDTSAQPSIIVLRSDGNMPLWNLAKQFNTTISAITEANPNLAGKVPERGELLLIVKKR